MLLGNYGVLGEIGRGASARVLRAQHKNGRFVAIKILTNANRRDAYLRFVREQAILRKLSEAEGFVPILDAGVSPHGPYFVMPLMTGGTLRARLERDGALDVEETYQLGRKLAVAIGWAHHRNIVHRDLKPENILFTADDRPLISDLGIARYVIETSTGNESITHQGAFLGTPVYMAPEQMADSKSVDARADIFSLAAILYECLCGRPPFAGATFQETVARATSGRYTPIHEARVDTPHYFAHTIRMALSVDPAFRHPNGFRLARSLGAKLPQAERLDSTVVEIPASRRRIKATTKESPPPPDSAPRPRLRRTGFRVAWLTPFTPLLVIPAAGLVAEDSASLPAPSKTVSAKAQPPKPPAPVVRKGWFGEPLPEGLRQGDHRPIYIFDTKKDLELDFVYVPPGDFYMGAINGGPNEKPIHTHPMPHGYYMGRTEITWGQYRTFCYATKTAEPAAPKWPITDEHPVVNVTWDDAVAFCDWAGLALPFESEWEKAARGDDTRTWPWGDKWLPGRANIFDRSCPEPGDPATRETNDDGFPYTAPAGSFPAGASPYGALDMAGNVFEWCSDWFDSQVYLEYSNGRTAPPTSGTFRVIRGGDWCGSRAVSATTFRAPWHPLAACPRIGFRACLRIPH